MLDPIRNDGAPTVRFQRSKKIKKTHKSHVCAICGGGIALGSQAEAITLATSDDVALFTRYCHDGKAGLDECRQRSQGQF